MKSDMHFIPAHPGYFLEYTEDGQSASNPIIAWRLFTIDGDVHDILPVTLDPDQPREGGLSLDSEGDEGWPGEFRIVHRP